MGLGILRDLEVFAGTLSGRFGRELKALRTSRLWRLAP